MHPCNAGNATCESNADRIAVTLNLQKSGRAQLLEHLNFPLHSSLFPPQVALYTWRVFAAVRVAVGDDSLLLTAPQCLAKTASEPVPRCWLKLSDQVGSPVLQRFQAIGHCGAAHSLPALWALGTQLGSRNAAIRCGSPG